MFFFFFSSRRRHTRFKCDWSSDVCSSDLCEINFHVSSRTLQRYQRLALHVRANATPESDLEAILDGGIEAALRSFRWREEDLPAAPRADRSSGDAMPSGDGKEHNDNAARSDNRGTKTSVR